MNIRVGFGYDMHRLKEGRALWLGEYKLIITLASKGIQMRMC